MLTSMVNRGKLYFSYAMKILYRNREKYGTNASEQCAFLVEPMISLYRTVWFHLNIN